MGRRLGLEIVCLVLLAACVPTVTPTLLPPTEIPPTVTPKPPTATPPTSPISPLATPTLEPAVILPLSAPRVITANVVNPGFETGGCHPNPDVQEFTAGCGWSVFWFDRSPCIAGDSGCIITACPMNCAKSDKTCPQASDCWWMRPELKMVYKPDYPVSRVHSGLWAQYGFCQGRQCWSGIYQRVYVGVGNTITVTAWGSAWQCLNSPDCRFSHMNESRKVELATAWGITSTNCPGDAVCQYAASDVPKYLASNNPRKNDPVPTMHMRLGLDPSGTFTGTQWSGKFYDDGQKVWLAPNLNNIVWGAEFDTWDTWAQYTVTATAKSDYVTLIASWRPEWFTSHWNNDIAWDDFEVRVQLAEPSRMFVYLPLVMR